MSALLVLVLAVGTVLLDAAPAAALEGGTSRGSAVPLPFAGDDLDGTVVASNSEATNARGTDPYWNNVAWFSYTPSVTQSVVIRARSTDPSGWDNTLELWTAGSMVVQRDDFYGLDAALTVTLDAGTSYYLGLGGFSSGSKGTVDLIFGDGIPTEPRDVGATAGDRGATVSWTEPADTAGAVTGYRVWCTPDGGSATECAQVNGSPPVTFAYATGLTNGVAYTVQVQAVGYLGASPLSGGVSVTPRGTTAVTFTTSVPPTSGQAFDLRAAVTRSDGLPATGTLSVTFDSATADLPLVDGVATIADVALPAGTYPASATYVGDAAVAGSSGAAGIAVARRAQTLTFQGVPASLTYADPASTVTATSSAGLPVTVTAAGACALTGGELTTTAAGPCTLTATQAGDAETLEATASVVLEVGRRSQAVTFDDVPALVYGQAPVPVTATSSVGLPVTVAASGACALTDGELTTTAAGPCTLTATQAGDAVTAPAPEATVTVDVARRPQSITLDGPDALVYGQAPVPVTAISSVGLPVTVAASGACALTDGELTTTAAGPCTLTATQAGDAVTAPAPEATVTVDVAKRPQVVAISDLPTLVTGVRRLAVAAVSDRGLPVALTATGACSYEDGVVQVTGVGRCVVTATAEPDAVTAAGRAVAVVHVVAAPASVTAAIVAEPGDRAASTPVLARGSQLLPGSLMTVTVYSEPLLVATVVVGADGTAEVPGTLPALEGGNHRLVVRGTALDGSPVEHTIPLAVTDEGTIVWIGTAPALAATGATPEEAALLAGVWVLVGLVLVAARRVVPRRRGA